MWLRDCQSDASITDEWNLQYCRSSSNVCSCDCLECEVKDERQERGDEDPDAPRERMGKLRLITERNAQRSSN